jgi:hypothetical protein
MMDKTYINYKRTTEVGLEKNMGSNLSLGIIGIGQERGGGRTIVGKERLTFWQARQPDLHLQLIDLKNCQGRSVLREHYH